MILYFKVKLDVYKQQHKAKFKKQYFSVKLFPLRKLYRVFHPLNICSQENVPPSFTFSQSIDRDILDISILNRPFSHRRGIFKEILRFYMNLKNIRKSSLKYNEKNLIHTNNYTECMRAHVFV